MSPSPTTAPSPPPRAEAAGSVCREGLPPAASASPPLPGCAPPPAPCLLRYAPRAVSSRQHGRRGPVGAIPHAAEQPQHAQLQRHRLGQHVVGAGWWPRGRGRDCDGSAEQARCEACAACSSSHMRLRPMSRRETARGWRYRRARWRRSSVRGSSSRPAAGASVASVPRAHTNRESAAAVVAAASGAVCSLCSGVFAAALCRLPTRTTASRRALCAGGERWRCLQRRRQQP